MKFLLPWLLLVALLLDPSICRGDDMTSATLEKLKSMDQITAAERESLLAEIEKEWHAVKEVLIMSLFSKQEETRYSAAYLLGLYRYSQAADSLAAVITMECKESYERGRESRWDKYPAVEALIRIGKPSVLSMVRNLETSDSEEIRRLSARVIYYVEGPAFAKLVLEKAIAEQRDSTKRARIESSLRYIEQKTKE